MSERGIKEMSEAYRKIRNTFRYMLGNLEDYANFDPATVPPESLHEIDRWALGQLNDVIRDVRAAYEAFEFYRAYQRIYKFCSGELSSFYLDVLKDRLYAELPDGPDRRAAQFVLAKMHEVLTCLLAPIIPHTAEELWGSFPASQGRPASVHLAEFPEPEPMWDDGELALRWKGFLEMRNLVLHTLEVARGMKKIGSSQEAVVLIYGGRSQNAEMNLDKLNFVNVNRNVLQTIWMVSDIDFPDLTYEPSSPRPVELLSPDRLVSADGLHYNLASADSLGRKKCERCWNYRAEVGQSTEHPNLCGRCVRVIKALNGVQ
jgi:isoleucyl-tRNA synthetase